MPDTQYYKEEKTGALRNASRLLVPLPGDIVPGPDKHLLFKQLYAALLTHELEERESAAQVRTQGIRGYDKPLSGGQRKRCRRMARRMALAYVTPPPSPKKRVFSRKPRKDPAKRAVYYKPTGVTPEGAVLCEEFRGGRGRASSAGFKHSTTEAATTAYLRDLVFSTEPSLVATALNAGYSGPLPEDLDDEALAAQKPGLFARLWNLRKAFG